MVLRRIESIFPISLYHTVAAHGWVRLAPWTWDSIHNELSRPERLENGSIVTIKLSQSVVQEFKIHIDKPGLEQFEYHKIESTVKRWLSIDWDPTPAIRIAETLDQRVARFIESGGGRFLRCSTFYEDLVKTVCTINANWGFTNRMISSIVDRLGDGVFPRPLDLIESGETFLRHELRLGFRAKVMVELSNQLLEKGVIDCQGNLIHSKPRFDDLLGLNGLGPYSASHLMMLCHDFSKVPIDSEVTKYCKERYNIEPDNIETFFAAWGDYKFLGYKLSRILAR